MDIEAYDAARNAIAKTGFTPEVQTKISLFLMAAKNANALFLGAVEMQPFVGVAQQFLHTQYFHEMEGVILLSKVTRWASDPRIFFEGFAITAPIWNDWRMISGIPGIGGARSPDFFRGLALGHALLSQVRMAPVIPAGYDETDPYVVAIRHIEQDNARMIQTQINLLRTIFPEMPADEAETLIDEKHEVVTTTFIRFLQWLTD